NSSSRRGCSAGDQRSSTGGRRRACSSITSIETSVAEEHAAERRRGGGDRGLGRDRRGYGPRVRPTGVAGGRGGPATGASGCPLGPDREGRGGGDARFLRRRKPGRHPRASRHR